MKKFENKALILQFRRTGEEFDIPASVLCLVMRCIEKQNTMKRTVNVLCGAGLGSEAPLGHLPSTVCCG